MDRYRLDGSPYPEGDEGLFEWAKDLEDTRGRIVEQNHLWNGIFLSTVWLGLNHNFMRHGPPLIFETMAFNNIGEYSYCFGRRWGHCSPDLWQQRYSTLHEADEGHQIAKRRFRSIGYTLRWWFTEVMSHVFDDEF